MSGVAKSIKVAMRNRPAGFIAELTRRLKYGVADDTPVRTGKLQGGWRGKGRNTGEIEIWNNVDYASYVEEDGRKPQHMLRSNTTQAVVRALAREVQQDLE